MSAQPQTEQPPQSQLGNLHSDSPQLQVLPEPKPKPRTRNGKIARLPCLERDMVNRMLRNSIAYKQIVGALDEVGITVTERNISNWKTRGGYKEWCLEQDRALETRLLQDNLIEHLRKNNATQLPEVGLQLAATFLSQFLLQPEARQQLSSTPEKYARIVASLCRLAGQIHTLQKYRDDSAKELGFKHHPERIRREGEAALESVRQTFSSYIPDNSQGPLVPPRNYLPKDL